MMLSPYKVGRSLRRLEHGAAVLRASLDSIPAQTTPGSLTFYEPEPPRLPPDEGDLLCGVWEDIEAQERRVVEVLEVTRHPYENEDRALVRRGDGNTEEVVLPEDVKLKAGHDYGTSYRLYMLVDMMNTRGL